MSNLSGQTFPFSILKEDLKEGAEFHENDNCPFKQAVARQFPQYTDAWVSTDRVYPGKFDYYNDPHIATIAEGFYADEFDELSEKGIEFHTTITFL